MTTKKKKEKKKGNTPVAHGCPSGDSPLRAFVAQWRESRRLSKPRQTIPTQKRRDKTGRQMTCKEKKKTRAKKYRSRFCRALPAQALLRHCHHRGERVPPETSPSAPRTRHTVVVEDHKMRGVKLFMNRESGARVRAAKGFRGLPGPRRNHGWRQGNGQCNNCEQRPVGSVPRADG